MLLTNSFLFSRFPSQKRPRSNNFITILIIGGLVAILLSTFLALALTSPEEPDEYDDLFLVEGLGIWSMACFCSGLVLLGRELGVFETIMRLEYLRSHIGEKRFADSIHLLLRARCLKTDLWDRSVFCLSGALVFHGGKFFTNVFCSRSLHSISFKETLLSKEACRYARDYSFLVYGKQNF